MYNKRVWLSKEELHFTGSLVCFHGDYQYKQEIEETAFIEIADCSNKIRLHVSWNNDYKEYINKINKIINELSAYKTYLEQTKAESKQNF